MSDRKAKISIIMPVYNADSYLERAMDSCLAQTVMPEEIILVDDCSQDRSPDMIRRYAQQYPEIVTAILLEKNVGHGAARNLAIERSRGDYILFLDSDDFLSPDTCEKLFEAAIAEDADIVGGDYITHKGDREWRKNVRYNTVRDPQTDQDGMANYIAHPGLFQTKIYRKTLFTEHNIMFPEGLLYEDSYVNFLTGLYANRIIKVSGAFYHYHIYNRSVSHNRNDLRHYERVTIVNKTVDECKERGLYDRYKDLIDLKYIMMMAGAIRGGIVLYDHPDRQRLKELCDQVREKVPDFRKLKYYKKIVLKRRLLLETCMISPSLAILMYKGRK